MVLYRESPKDFTKKPLELINEFGKVTVYKINIRKSVSFLYTNNEVAEREIKKTIPVWYWHKNGHRSVEQKRDPKNKHMIIWSINL